MNFRLATPSVLVDLNRLTGSPVTFRWYGELRIAG
jgi:hypothetical protein